MTTSHYTGITEAIPSTEFIVRFSHDIAQRARIILTDDPGKIDIFPFVVLVNEAVHTIGKTLTSDSRVHYQKNLYGYLTDVENAISHLRAELAKGSASILGASEYCIRMIFRLTRFIVPSYSRL